MILYVNLHQLIDFDFVENDYVETAIAMADSFEGTEWKSKKYVYSNQIKDLEKVLDAEQQERDSDFISSDSDLKE